MKKGKTKKRKKIEWSKLFATIIALIIGTYGMWCGYEYYRLVKLAIETESSTMPDSTLAVTCVTAVLGCLLTYLLYQGTLKTSLNKHHLKIDNTTGIVTSIVEGDLMGAIDKKKEEETSEDTVDNYFS